MFGLQASASFPDGDTRIEKAKIYSAASNLAALLNQDQEAELKSILTNILFCVSFIEYVFLIKIYNDLIVFNAAFHYDLEDGDKDFFRLFDWF